MKNLIFILLAFFAATTAQAQITLGPGESMVFTIPISGIRSTTTPQTLTVSDVKDIIAFPKDSGVYKSLSGLVDCWYLTAKNDGCTDEESALVALEKLGEKFDEMARGLKE